MPAKIEITEKQYQEVELLAAYLTQEQIADYLGMKRRTFIDRMEKDDKLSAHYKKGKANAIGKAASQLMKQVSEGNLTAIIFFLKTQAGWRETNNLNINDPSGKAIPTFGSMYGKKPDEKKPAKKKPRKTVKKEK